MIHQGFLFHYRGLQGETKEEGDIQKKKITFSQKQICQDGQDIIVSASAAKASATISLRAQAPKIVGLTSPIIQELTASPSSIKIIFES